jgi:hypothetical protein
VAAMASNNAYVVVVVSSTYPRADEVIATAAGHRVGDRSYHRPRRLLTAIPLTETTETKTPTAKGDRCARFTPKRTRYGPAIDSPTPSRHMPKSSGDNVFTEEFLGSVRSGSRDGGTAPPIVDRSVTSVPGTHTSDIHNQHTM